MSAFRARVAAGLAVLALLGGCGGGPPADEPASATRVDVTTVDTPLQPCPDQPDRDAAGAETLPGLTFPCFGGGSLDLSRAPGVPTVVNLWGSWCPPCRDEMPLLQELAAAAGERVQVVGVISKDGVPQANSFAADAGITFPGAYDRDGKLMAEQGLNVLPYTYFLDADGGLTYTQVGPLASLEQPRGLVAEHLGVTL